jgi:peptidyl-prolyl cis-trans isomerase C
MHTTRGKLSLALAIVCALAWSVPRAWAEEEGQGTGQAAPSEKEAPAKAAEEKPVPAVEKQPASSAEVQASVEAKQPLDERIAVVNGVIIKRSDFDRDVKRYQRQLSMMGKPLMPSDISDLRKDVFDNLINAELLYQESQKAGIAVDEASINQKSETLKKRFPADAEYQDWLVKMNVTEADLTAQFKRATVIEQFVDKEIVQKISIPEEETKAFYDNNPTFFKQPEQVQASHILIKVDANADPAQKAEARKKIEDIQQKLKEGADFAELAKEFSECPSAPKGGDLGYFRRGQMVKPFEETAFALNPGETSDIVETNFGFHIIKVVDKKPEMTTPYDSIRKDRIEQRLKQEKVQKELGEYIEKLKQTAKIEKYLEEAPAEETPEAPAEAEK